MIRKITIAGGALAAAAAAVALLVPAGAGAHATVSPFQPQSSPLTAARTLYTLRVPNETESQGTYKVVMFVPEAVQEAISVKTMPGWRVKLNRKFTGKTEKFGDEVYKIYAISKITWTARAGEEIEPGFFAEFFFRFQNPATAQKLCFPAWQYYRAKGYTPRKARRIKRLRKPEIVKWNGPADADLPASCVNVVAAPPA